MSVTNEIKLTIKHLNRIGVELNHRFSGRKTAVDLMKLALLCQEHVLLLGPPGSGKSELVSRFAGGVQARLFQYLLTRFTEPAEIFGPMDIKAFREKSQYKVITEGMLPTAQIAFLDEVFQSSSAILNTLLTLVHERLFFNGNERVNVPLITVFGASNTLPNDPTLHAFSDRFALRLMVELTPDDSLSDLFEKGWDLELDRIDGKDTGVTGRVTPESLGAAYTALSQVDASSVMPIYEELMRRLRAEGVMLSERRMIKGLKFIRGAALLDGRDKAANQDLWPLNHMWNTQREITITQDVVQPLVDEAGGPALRTHRDLVDLVDELERMQGVRPESSGAVTAHLMALGQLRREVIMHHSTEGELIGRIDNTVQSVLEGMTDV